MVKRPVKPSPPCLPNSKITRRTIGVEIPYPIYERVKMLVSRYDCQIESEDFGAEIC
jgi:hypothetical protein